MSMKLDNFRSQLQKLVEKGVDLDPEQVIADILKPVVKSKVKKPELDEGRWNLLTHKIENILKDYHDFYSKKGCTLKVLFYIGKDKSADTFTESFDYDSKLSVISTAEIGTEGKYEPVDCIGEKE